LISDPLRNDESGASDDGAALDRDAKIEKLLLVGLDHYFSARYELAINVWTRALFLDRNHARARAYIERARSALAEQQRESEELLHSGVAAFNRGESGEARRLLHAAIDRGAPSDEALAVLERLNRLDAAVAAHAAAPAESRQQRAAVSGAAAITAPAGSRAVVGLAIGVLAVVGWATWTNRIDWRSFLALAQSAARGDAPVARNAAPVTRDAPLPLPRRGEDALARARSLASTGHLRDALSALEMVRPTDNQRADADRLRADIQRQLLALTTLPAATGVDRDRIGRRNP
jgi:hypothetical protein